MYRIARPRTSALRRGVAVVLCVVAQQYKDRHKWPETDCEFLADCKGETFYSARLPGVSLCRGHSLRLSDLGLARFAMLYGVSIRL